LHKFLIASVDEAIAIHSASCPGVPDIDLDEQMERSVGSWLRRRFPRAPNDVILAVVDLAKRLVEDMDKTQETVDKIKAGSVH